MSPETEQLGPLVLIAPLLVIMALHDLKNLKISNILVLILLFTFLLSAPFYLSFQESMHRFLGALIVFALGAIGFAFRLWGGGDVKAISALVLFIPSNGLLHYFNCFAFSMGAGMLIVVSGRHILAYPECSWRAFRPKAGYPMGVSIAMSGILWLVISLAIST
ncbi:A24 family peptidase [Ruegeria arenilitoris]|uniref:A24 family peptidase n=1 Tax=Ruegeria arenilitoris TaxID=1173585 RepID=UPI00147EFF70|nr:prepilin peptidase [Ruegeria arenilitoris]